MSKYLLIACALLCGPLIVTSGCKKPDSGSGGGGGVVVIIDNLDKYKDEAKLAGQLAAGGWLALENPQVAQVRAVERIVDQLKANLTLYSEVGFVASYAELAKVIDDSLPVAQYQAENRLARILLGTLLGELDNLFDRHPDWRVKGAKVAGLLTAFCDGAKDQLKLYQ